MKVEKDSPLVFKFKKTFDENEDCEEVRIKDNAPGDEINEEESDDQPKRRSSRKKEARVLKNISQVDLIPLYQHRLSISERKKKDLRDLVEKSVIPKTYSYFNNSL